MELGEANALKGFARFESADARALTLSVCELT